MPSTEVGCDDGAVTAGLGNDVQWFAVRCIFAIGRGDDDEVHTYEERITLWRASHFDEAIALAEAEATEYATAIEGGSDAYLGLAQCYQLADEVGQGAEVFSLMRDSRLAPAEYLNTFFDSGDERQQMWSSPT
jgi:uncharacterized protein DUF4288